MGSVPPDDPLAGLLLGSFVGDALSLGVHWIYDPAELVEKAGRVTDYRDPFPDSWHPGKRAGEQSHVGDQALVLLRSLAARRRFDAADFEQRWRGMWAGYGDYVDKATQHVLEEGSAMASEELAGAARIAPIVAAYHGQDPERMFDVLSAQTWLTHASVAVRSAAWFFAELARNAGELGSVSGALARVERVDFPGLPVREVLVRVRGMDGADPVAALGELGRSCALADAFPAILYLLVHRGDDLESALVDNAMAGGDNCTRGLLLGMVLGAAQGVGAIPAAWLEGLACRDEVQSFIDSLAQSAPTP